MNYIVLTKEELKRRFDEYNAAYFYGRLGACRFYVTGKNVSDYGSYTYQHNNAGGGYSIIRIGKCVNWTDESLKCILVHEMIHMYVRTIENIRIDGLLGHGWYFRKHRRRIERDYGIHIEIHPAYEYINKKLSPKLWERVVLTLIDW